MQNLGMGFLMIMCAVLGASTIVGGDFDPYMDTLVYSINWPGAGSSQQHSGIADIPLESLTDDNSIVVTSKDNEKYKCALPDMFNGAYQSTDVDYNGPSEMELLQPLLSQTTCSYRIESYWTYEMCHGRFLRQYHEEKEGQKKPKMQEYFLGYYKEDENQQSKDEQQKTATEATEQPDTENAATEEQGAPPPKKRPPVHKVEGYDMPYFEVQFSGGTKCDLTGGQRRASLRYVCIAEGRGEVYELKESSTCEYDVVILTSLLCSHPNYKAKSDPVNHIQCHPMDGSPARPRSLESLETENRRYNRKEFWEFELRDFLGQNEKDKDDDEDEIADSLDILPKVPGKQPKAQPSPHKPADQDTAPHYERKPAKTPSVIPGEEKNVIKDFLSGDFCLQGGHGWWKQEFCYGRYALQFHEDHHAPRTGITLGTWDKQAHINWLQENPLKKPKPIDVRGSVSLYYGSGDICDLTGKPRWVEVKLKCKKDPEQPHAIIIYLKEPKTCEYVLVVESPILCTLISQSDDLGLFTAT